MILEDMASQFKWVALGFGAVMLLFGLFGSDKAEIEAYQKAKAEEEEEAEAEEEAEIENLNKPKEGQ